MTLFEITKNIELLTIQSKKIKKENRNILLDENTNKDSMEKESLLKQKLNKIKIQIKEDNSEIQVQKQNWKQNPTKWIKNVEDEEEEIFHDIKDLDAYVLITKHDSEGKYYSFGNKNGKEIRYYLESLAAKINFKLKTIDDFPFGAKNC